MRVLIVEDDFLSRRMLQRFLAPYGECDIAVNGKEALQAFNISWIEKQPYDLICLDIMMPEMNGHQALAAIRQAEAEGNPAHHTGYPPVKIIITTARNDHQSVATAMKSKCEAYLIKPLNKKTLLDKLCSLGLIAPQETTGPDPDSLV